MSKPAKRVPRPKNATPQGGVFKNPVQKWSIGQYDPDKYWIPGPSKPIPASRKRKKK